MQFCLIDFLSKNLDAATKITFEFRFSSKNIPAYENLIELFLDRSRFRNYQSLLYRRLFRLNLLVLRLQV